MSFLAVALSNLGGIAGLIIISTIATGWPADVALVVAALLCLRSGMVSP